MSNISLQKVNKNTFNNSNICLNPFELSFTVPDIFRVHQSKLEYEILLANSDELWLSKW